MSFVPNWQLGRPPLTKPSKVARIEKKQATKAEVSKARAKSDKADKARLAAIREACWQRDKAQCRACGRQVELYDLNALNMGHAHHLIYRSALGSDELQNRCWLCPRCHEAEHRALLQITGDPDAVLTFKEYDATSGKLLKTWESPVPR